MKNNCFSPFQLHGTRITNLSVTNPFVSISERDIELKVSITNGNIDIQETNDGLQATLLQSVKLTAIEKDSDQEMELNISVEGFFTFPDKDKKLFADMLILNGNSSLYSIIRAYVINISSLTFNSGTITLPMVNFYELMKAKQKENEQ